MNFFARALVLLSLLAATGSGCVHGAGKVQPKLEVTASAQDGAIKGKWKSQGNLFRKGGHKNEWVQMEFSLDAAEKLYFGRPYGDFRRHDSETDAVKFSIPTNAGDLEFTGGRRKPKAGGEFIFTPAPEYAEGIKIAMGAEPSLTDLLRLGVFGMPIEYVQAMRKVENSFKLDEIIKLRNFAVSPEYVSVLQKAGIKYKSDEIVKMKNFGVAAEYPAKMAAAGYKFNTEEIVKMKNFNVTAEYAADWKGSGAVYSAEELVKLRSFGVSSSYGADLKKAGLSLKAEEIIKLKNFGVSSSFLAQVLPAGKYTVDEIVRLRNFGVQPEFIAAWNAAGYSLTADELVKLKNFGVPIEYAKASNVEGRKQVDVDTLIKLRQRGVSPEEVGKLRE